MKKWIIGLLILVFLAGGSFAATRSLIGYQLTDTRSIEATTLTTAETVYSVTLSQGGGVADFEIHAVSGNLRWCIGGTTTEAYITIPQDGSWWPDVPFLLADDTTLYFWSDSNNVRAEVLYRYY